MKSTAPSNLREGPPRFGAVSSRQRSFEKRLAAFLVPLLLIVGLLELVLWRARETWPVRHALDQQRQHPGALFMRGLLDQAFYPYKLRQIEERSPRILVLGSSRVMEFRREMFGNHAAKFYNGGGMIQDLGDLDYFAQSLSTNLPEVVILGLDLWWFNENVPINDGLRSRGAYDAAGDWQAHVKALRRFKSSRARKPLLQAAQAGNDHVGIEARNSGAGFRADGSMRYNLAAPTNAADWAFVDREKPPVAERVRKQSSQFVAQRGDIAQRVALLERALDTFEKKGVLVAGFLPPFSEESARLLENGPGHAELWRSVRSAVPPLFAKRRLPFFDASLTSNLGLNDTYLIDGMHGGETLHLHLLARLLEFDALKTHLPELAQQLARILASPGTNPWHPEYGP